MKIEDWQPDESLIENGWEFHSFSRESFYKSGQKEKLLENFIDVIAIPSKETFCNEKVLEIYVKKLPVYEEEEPNGGFIKVALREPFEEITKEYLENLKKKFCQEMKKEVLSVLILPGERYITSKTKEGKTKRIYEKIIWMR